MHRKSKRSKKKRETRQVENVIASGGPTTVERRRKGGEKRSATKKTIRGQKIKLNRTDGWTIEEQETPIEEQATPSRGLGTFSGVNVHELRKAADGSFLVCSWKYMYVYICTYIYIYISRHASKGIEWYWGRGRGLYHVVLDIPPLNPTSPVQSPKSSRSMLYETYHFIPLSPSSENACLIMYIRTNMALILTPWPPAHQPFLPGNGKGKTGENNPSPPATWHRVRPRGPLQPSPTHPSRRLGFSFAKRR